MKRAVLLAVFACSPPHGPRAQLAATNALHVATKDRVTTLDPTFAYDEATMPVVHALFATLVDYEPSSPDDAAAGLRLVPGLADRWDVSPDGTRYTFHLRPGIAYADGTPIAAGDFQYSLERALQATDSPFGQFLVDVAGADAVARRAAPHATGIVARGDELVIDLVRPNAAFASVLAMTFATPQRADRVAAAGAELRRAPLASGPYELAAWDEGERVVLRRNPHFWDAGRGRIATIELRENLPRDTQFLMFERGELDTIEHLAASDYVWIVAQPAWQPYIHRRAAMNAFGSRMNVRVRPFDDRRVRQALNYALDKRHVVKLLAGTAVPAHGILPPGMLGRDDALAPYPHDPAKARALLAAAGYPDGFDVEYATLHDDDAQKLAASLQADLAAVGVRVRISVLDLEAFGAALGSPSGPPFMITTWTADYADPSDFLDARFHSRMIADANSNNDAFYANRELDTLLDAARASTDPAARAAAYRRAERILYDDAPYVWGYHQLATEVVQPYVKGYAVHPVWLRDYASAWLEVASP